jgi:hypothetical protein
MLFVRTVLQETAGQDYDSYMFMYIMVHSFHVCLIL